MKASQGRSCMPALWEAATLALQGLELSCSASPVRGFLHELWDALELYGIRQQRACEDVPWSLALATSDVLRPCRSRLRRDHLQQRLKSLQLQDLLTHLLATDPARGQHRIGGFGVFRYSQQGQWLPCLGPHMAASISNASDRRHRRRHSIRKPPALSPLHSPVLPSRFCHLFQRRNPCSKASKA